MQRTFDSVFRWKKKNKTQSRFIDQICPLKTAHFLYLSLSTLECRVRMEIVKSTDPSNDFPNLMQNEKKILLFSSLYLSLRLFFFQTFFRFVLCNHHFEWAEIICWMRMKGIRSSPNGCSKIKAMLFGAGDTIRMEIVFFVRWFRDCARACASCAHRQWDLRGRICSSHNTRRLS